MLNAVIFKLHSPVWSVLTSAEYEHYHIYNLQDNTSAFNTIYCTKECLPVW